MSKFKAGDKVRVVKASLPSYWYADKIGEVFTITDVYGEYSLSYRIKEYEAGLLQHGDIELVKENDRDGSVNTFKIGDKVKCIDPTYRNDWGVGEMVIVRHYNTDISIHCQHPSMGIGGFFPSQLEHADKPASLELQKQELLKQIEQIDKQIADRKLEEQNKLGEKEVEIKLTLNELAWVVANIGATNEFTTTESITHDYHLGSIDYEFKPPVDNEHGELYDKLADILKDQF